MTTRILLVEDDPVSRDIIATLLKSRGHEVDAVDDGFGGLRLAQETTYDLVFVDYHLPEMDGYALARLMRSLAEKRDVPLKMVAITADRFGLAARRGVDSIFDRVLPKPIEPEDLFAIVDEFIGSASAADDLDAFLAEPSQGVDAGTAGQMLWRMRGLDALPKATAFPPPSAAQRATLDYCFTLVEPAQADCLILLGGAGCAAVEAVRAHCEAYLQPLIVLDSKLSPIADACFEIGDGDTWSAAVAAISGFAERRQSLRAGIAGATDFDTRVTAYMFVADRPLELCRDAAGRTSVPYTAGFSATALIEAIKRLAGRGFVVATHQSPSADGQRRLSVALTAKGRAFVADPTVNTISDKAG